ncbi:MAG: ATP-binding protein [Phycisphaerales bacterium]
MSQWDYFALTLCAVSLLAVVAWRLRATRLSGTYRTATALVLVGVLIAGWFATENAGRNALTHIRDLVSGYAPTFAREAEALGHVRLSLDTPPDDPTYLAIIEAEKRWLAANPAIADIYTFKTDAAGAVRFMVDSETDYDRDGTYAGEREQRTDIGEVYEEASEQLKAAFTGQATFDSEPVTDRWGTWVSASVPIRGPAGEVDGVLGVDFFAAKWFTARQDARITAIGYVAAVVLLVVFGSATIGLLQGAITRARIAEEQARSASSAKSAFLANMSHEIRTPLTAILGFAGLLAADDAAPAERAQHAHTIERNGEHLLALISDVLDISKIEAGHMTVESLPVSPVGLAGEVVQLLGSRAGAAGVLLATEFNWPLPETIPSDPVRLRQILVNLIGNAIKFTPKGRVVISLSAEEGEGARLLRIRVRDNGIGMTHEQAARLFASFQQADTSTTRRFGGTGLGLSISRQLARLLGGDITVTSRAEPQPDHGSVFEVALPVPPGSRLISAALESTPAQRAPMAIDTAALAGLRVLVVDDGPDNQRLLRLLLTKSGAVVEIAVDGRKGVDAAMAAVEAGAGFDVVFMDMQMPVLDGYAATTELRARHYSGAVVGLTANIGAGERDRCLHAGCTEYLAKPLDRRLLVETCRRVASQHARPALARAA